MNFNKPVIAIDIETTDTLVTAGVWDIGIVAYTPGAPSDANVLEYTSMFEPGGSSSQSTMQWISERPEVQKRFRQALTCGNTQKDIAPFLSSSLLDIAKKTGTDPTERGACVMLSWGTFDFPILKHVLEARSRLSANDYWHYGNECDLRSVAVFNDMSLKPDTSKHEALSDASQVLNTFFDMKYTDHQP